jgi:hypothetical protein
VLMAGSVAPAERHFKGRRAGFVLLFTRRPISPAPRLQGC